MKPQVGDKFHVEMIGHVYSLDGQNYRLLKLVVEDEVSLGVFQLLNPDGSDFYESYTGLYSVDDNGKRIISARLSDMKEVEKQEQSKRN